MPAALSVRRWSTAMTPRMEVRVAQAFANVCAEQTAKGRHTGLSWEHSDQPHVCGSYKDLGGIQAGGAGDPGILPHCWGTTSPTESPVHQPQANLSHPRWTGQVSRNKRGRGPRPPCLLLVCLPPGSPGALPRLTHPPEDAAFKISGRPLGNKPDPPQERDKISAAPNRKFVFSGKLRQVQLRKLSMLGAFLPYPLPTAPPPGLEPSRCRVPSAAHASPL